VKFRKQATTPPPGEQFLRALALGREEPVAPDPAPTGGSGLERRLLETERRAATAEAALEQIRSEAEDRLAAARDAIAREREARLAAERELGDGVHAAPAEPAPEAAPATDEEPAEPVPEQVAEAEPKRAPRPVRSALPPDEAGGEGAWPTPWLGPDRPQ
jgi:hypothetical protein